MAREPSVTLTFRAPKSMEAALDDMAVQLGRDRSECIREAISQYLDAGPNSLLRRVTLIEQRLESMANLERSAQQDRRAEDRRGDANAERVAELTRKLGLAEADLAASQEALETISKMVEQAGGSPDLLRWIIDFRRDHPPK